jgi:hypothetical protein
MLGSLSCSFTSIFLLSNLICVLSVMLGIRLESKDIDVNEHERLPTLHLRHKLD